GGTVTVTDGAGAGFVGGTVTVGDVDGLTITTSGPTGAAGTTSLTVTADSDAQPGARAVPLTVEGVAGSLTVTVEATPAAIHVVSVGSATAGGATSALIEVRDIEGHPVPGATVNLDAPAGLRVPASVT